jgi:hypothetical protein
MMHAQITLSSVSSGKSVSSGLGRFSAASRTFTGSGFGREIGPLCRSKSPGEKARQSELFREGKTQLSKVGCHGFGVAADLGLFVAGTKYDPRGQDYIFFQALCVKHKLISGIGWGTPHARHTFTDYDHVQNVPIFRQGDLFAGRWYPPPDYDPIDDMIKHGVKGI